MQFNLLPIMAKHKIRTIQELHKKSGVSAQTLYQMANGERRTLKIETLEKICKALDCEIYELIEKE